MAVREGHFMPPALLDPLATLEPLGPEELGVVIDLALPLERAVEVAVAG